MDPPSSPQLELEPQPSSPLPTLPTEIIHRIIQLALPRLSFATFRERYDTLVNLTCVNKLWGELAQRELVRHVRVLKREGEDLEETIGMLPSKRGLVTRSLWVADVDYEGGPVDGSDIVACASKLPGLTQLRVSLQYDRIVELDFGALSGVAQDLEELVIDFATLSISPTAMAMRLPRLRRLALSFLERPTDYASILATADLPQLEALVLILEGPSSAQEADLGSALVLHAPHLRSFGLSMYSEEDDHVDLPAEVWSTFHQLNHLLIDGNADANNTLANVPSSLASLRFQRPELYAQSLQPLLPTLKISPPSLAALKRLVVGAPAQQQVSDSADDFNAELGELQEWCGTCGVSVEGRPFGNCVSTREGVEDVLEIWDDI